MKPAPDVVVVLTTLPEDADHAAFAGALVDERLAACVSVFAPMDSTYRWGGGIERGRERQVAIKTAPSRLADLEARLAALHPYEVPEVLVLPVAFGGAAYLEWLRASTTPAL